MWRVAGAFCLGASGFALGVCVGGGSLVGLLEVTKSDVFEFFSALTASGFGAWLGAHFAWKQADKRGAQDARDAQAREERRVAYEEDREAQRERRDEEREMHRRKDERREREAAAVEVAYGMHFRDIAKLHHVILIAQRAKTQGQQVGSEGYFELEFAFNEPLVVGPLASPLFETRAALAKSRSRLEAFIAATRDKHLASLQQANIEAWEAFNAAVESNIALKAAITTEVRALVDEKSPSAPEGTEGQGVSGDDDASI